MLSSQFQALLLRDHSLVCEELRHNKISEECLGSLCRLSIHKDFLKQLGDGKQLYDLIIAKFTEKPRLISYINE